jgi:hypothetical protein
MKHNPLPDSLNNLKICHGVGNTVLYFFPHSKKDTGTIMQMEIDPVP